MYLYKKVSGYLVVFLIILAGVSGVDAQSVLPHFFPEGIIQTKEPAKQWQEWARYVNVISDKLMAKPLGSFVLGNDSIVVERTYFGQPIKMVFDGYIKVGNRIRYTSFNDQYFISQQQFDVVVNMMDKNIKEAVELDYAFWGPAEAKAISLAAKAAKKSESDFRAELEKDDPLNPGITFRELRHIPPQLERKDFIPFRELHLGLVSEPGVLGVTWLNTGIIYYTPAAAILDYLVGKPEVLAHEFVHGNKKLQNIPLTQGFDVELMASIPSMLFDETHLPLWFHGYVEVPRELIWVYFGFDFERARKEIVKYDLGMGSVVIDEQKFNEYSAKLVLAKQALMKALDRSMAEFYQDPIYWTAMNDKLTDKNSVIKIIMATMYNPTLLGGEEATMKWVETNKSKIKQFADEAFKESGAAQDDNPKSDEDMRLALLLLSKIELTYNVSDQDISAFLKFYKVSPKQALKLGPDKLKKNIEDFLAQQQHQMQGGVR